MSNAGLQAIKPGNKTLTTGAVLRQTFTASAGDTMLCSDAGSYITGSNLFVDGGRTIG